MKSALRWLLKTLYRVEVSGLEHLHDAGDRVLVVANHTSFLDAPLLAAFLPGELAFAITLKWPGAGGCDPLWPWWAPSPLTLAMPCSC